jgi:hypothetical protein
VSVNAPATARAGDAAVDFTSPTAGDFARRRPAKSVELQDPAGKPFPGFALGDCHVLFGDSLERPVRWKGGGDMSALAGKPLRLRVALRDADLYALQFSA